jgi:hypothetical protein
MEIAGVDGGFARFGGGWGVDRWILGCFLDFYFVAGGWGEMRGGEMQGDGGDDGRNGMARAEARAKARANTGVLRSALG